MKGTCETLPQEIPSQVFRLPIDLQTNMLYKIPCVNCQYCSYFGETGRCFSIIKNENTRNLMSWKETVAAQR